MYFTCGNYRHDDNEVNLSSIAKVPERLESGPVYRYKETWVADGEIFAASNAALTARLQLLELAYGSPRPAVEGGVAALFHDNGTATAHILGLGSLGGVRVVSFGYPQGGKEEYVTSRKYQIVLECTYLGDPNVPLIAFEERLAFEGGGIEYVWRKPLQGRPVRQPVGIDTWRAVQSGSAVGQFGPPEPPPPLWPAYLIGEARPDETSPKRQGPAGNPFYSDFAITWNYRFEADIPLIGQPHRFPG